jgi:hypothetical protein
MVEDQSESTGTVRPGLSDGAGKRSQKGVRAAFSRGRAFAPLARHLCFGKGAPNHSPEARVAEAATSLRLNFATELCSRGFLPRSHKLAIPGIARYAADLAQSSARHALRGGQARGSFTHSERQYETAFGAFRVDLSFDICIEHMADRGSYSTQSNRPCRLAFSQIQPD